MLIPKGKLNGPSGIAGEIKPPALSLALICQFAKCLYIEKGLRIPDNILFIN